MKRRPGSDPVSAPVLPPGRARLYPNADEQAIPAWTVSAAEIAGVC